MAARCPSSGRTHAWIACTAPPRLSDSCVAWISPRAARRSTRRSRARRSETRMLNRKLRFGMIGGGRGAFIGAVHRIAARMDGMAELVAGAFSSDAEKSKASARDLFVPRAYGSYQEMAAGEQKLGKDERID